jgi:hypothetical protein
MTPNVVGCAACNMRDLQFSCEFHSRDLSDAEARQRGRLASMAVRMRDYTCTHGSAQQKSMASMEKKVEKVKKPHFKRVSMDFFLLLVRAWMAPVKYLFHRRAWIDRRAWRRR